MTKMGRLAGYGVGDFGLNIYWNTLSIYLVYWYTNIVGIAPEIAGTIFFIGMIWDAFSDPIMANLSERVKTRHGTYRPFILYGSFGLGLGFILLFWVPPFSGIALIATLIAVGIIFRTCYTLVAIPYAAMSARLTYNSVERTEFSGVRMFFAFAGLLAVSNLLPPLARHFSGGEAYTPEGFQLTAAVGALAATAALLLCFLGTREKALLPKTEIMRFNFSDIAKVLSTNRALIILLVTVILQSAATASLMISLVFFIETNQPLFAAKEVVLTAFAIATMTGVPVWTLFSKALGKKVAWITSSLIFACLGLYMLLLGPLLISSIPLQVVGFGFCMGAFGVLLWSFIPDTVEYGQIHSGYRAEGVVFGSVLIVQKLLGGFMGFVVGIVLASIGYTADIAERSTESGAALIVFLSVCPSVLLLLSIIPILSLPLDRRIHADIVDKLSGGR